MFSDIVLVCLLRDLTVHFDIIGMIPKCLSQGGKLKCGKELWNHVEVDR